MRLTDAIAGLGRPVSYYPRLRKLTGSTNATIFLCNMIWWEGKGFDPDGWIFKSAEEIEEETGLSYKEQKCARKYLVGKGLLEERYDRLSHKMYFRTSASDVAEIAENMPIGFSRTPERDVRDDTGGTFDPMIPSDTSSDTTELGKKKHGDRRSESNGLLKQRVVDAYNRVAEKRAWYKQDGIPKSGEAGDLLGKRVLEEDFIRDLDRYMERLEALDWADSKRITFALRRQTFTKCMSGEWGPRPTTGSLPQHQENLDLSKPWNQAPKETA